MNKDPTMANSKSRSKPFKSFLRNSSSDTNLNGKRSRSGSFHMLMTGKSNGFRFWSGLSVASKEVQGMLKLGKALQPCAWSWG